MIIILTIPLILTSVLMVGKTVKENFENASKSLDEQIKDLQTEIDAMVEKGVSSDADKSAFKEKNEKLKNLMKQKNEPGKSSDKKSEPMSSMYNKPNRIDYASTVEDAYEDLNKILGGNGIKQLTDDTQKLMQQQLQLADAMKSMSPLMEQAKGLLQGFDLKNLSSLTNVGKNLQMPVDGN
jgi:hypothetical protein